MTLPHMSLPLLLCVTPHSLPLSIVLHPPCVCVCLQVRRLRTLLRSGSLTRVDYERLIDQQIAFAIGTQEALGVDVLVHGEPEVREGKGGRQGVCCWEKHCG